MTATAFICDACGAAPARSDARFCDTCGSPLGGTGGAAEFKQVTVLFADVVRSMDIAAGVGPERLREIMSTLFRCGTEVVRRYGGTVDKFTGDGLMALFGAPLALEDHALQACRAALEIHEAVQVLTDIVARRDGVNIRLRIGLNSGEVVAGDIGSGIGGYTAIGEQVGMAQRMESVAPPDGVMLSESTARLVETDTELGQPEFVTIKGCARPVPARRLVGVPNRSGACTRAETPLFGRQWEIAAVRGLLANALDGRGGVLGIVGPAGIGKSRLTREISAMAADRGAEIVTAYCESHTSAVPFHLATSLLRAAFGVGGSDQHSARERIRGEVPGATEEDLLLLEDLLGLADPHDQPPQIDPDARRRRITALLNTAILARQQSMLFIVEDAHWIDGVSESMLTDFLPVVAQTPTLFVITHRPEYRGALATFPGAHTIALTQLSDSETGALVGRLLGTEPSVAALATKIAERAAGNPFFAEQIVRELSQRGVLSGERGDYRTSISLNEIRVPATLQATIASRIDRLPPAAKRTLGAAAVIGLRFDPDLLEGLEADTSVDELLKAQMIDQVQYAPSPEYAFHHPLIRAVAYESQLVAVRGTLHRRLARVIEDRGRPDQDAALIAEHLESAGDLQDAYDWHMRAGEWANYRSGAAAHNSWNRARAIADRLATNSRQADAEMRITPRTLICGSAWRVGGSGAETGFEELRQLCENAGDSASLVIGMAGEVMSLALRAQRPRACLLAKELGRLLQTLDDPTLTVAATPAVLCARVEFPEDVDELKMLADNAIRAAEGDLRMGDVMMQSPLPVIYALRGIVRLWMGDDHWRNDFTEALRLGANETTTQAGINFYVCSGITLGLMTADDATVTRTARVLANAEKSGDNFTLNLARTSHGTALIHSLRGDTAQGLELLTQMHDDTLADRYSYGTLGFFEYESARAEAAAGSLDAAIERLRRFIDELFDTQGIVFLPLSTCLLVEFLLRRGLADDVSAAQAAIDRLSAFPLLDGLSLPDIYLHRMRALIGRAVGDATAYRIHRDRYREMATSLGFEGHMTRAAAMP